MTDLENRPEAPPTEEVKVVELTERPAIVVRISGPVESMPTMMGDAFGRTAEAITGAGAAFGGPPFARYLSFGELIEAEVGFPYQGSVEPSGELFVAKLPGGRAVTTTHVGPYDEIGTAWDRVSSWMRAFGLESAGPPWECYLTGPEEPGPPVTEIYFPIA